MNNARIHKSLQTFDYSGYTPLYICDKPYKNKAKIKLIKVKPASRTAKAMLFLYSNTVNTAPKAQRINHIGINIKSETLTESKV